MKFSPQKAWLIFPAVLVGLLLHLNVHAKAFLLLEEAGTAAPSYSIDVNAAQSTGTLDLIFQTVANALQFDLDNMKFIFTQNVDMNENQIKNVRFDNASTSTCNNGNKGRIYFDTDDNQTYVCNGTAFNQIDASGGGTLDDAYDSGGAGAGKTITVDTGAVVLSGTGSLLTLGDGTANDFSVGFNDGTSRTLTWDDSDTRFVFNATTRVEGNLGIVGEMFIGTDHTASDTDATLSIGKTGTVWRTLKYDATTDDQFEFNDDVNVAGSIVSAESSIIGFGTIPVDWNSGNQQYFELTQTGHTVTFSNATAGQILRLILCQDGVGNQTITTWPTEVKWAGGSAPALTSTADQCDVISFLATVARDGITLEVFGTAVTNF